MTDTVQAASVTDEIIDFLVSAPSPQDILNFKASQLSQERLRFLLDKNRNSTLTQEESAELDEMERMDHFITLLKSRIQKKALQG